MGDSGDEKLSGAYTPFVYEPGEALKGAALLTPKENKKGVAGGGVPSIVFLRFSLVSWVVVLNPAPHSRCGIITASS